MTILQHIKVLNFTFTYSNDLNNGRSQYSGDLKSGLDWILNGTKRGWVASGPDFEWNLKTGRPSILKSGQIAAILSKTICNLDRKVQILNGLVFKCLGLWLQPQLKRDHLKSDLQKVLISNDQISDPHCIRRKFTSPNVGYVRYSDPTCTQIRIMNGNLNTGNNK